MKLFNEMPVISDDSLDPGPERLTGFRHGVPVKGPHQGLHLTEQVLDFFVKLCILTVLAASSEELIIRDHVKFMRRTSRRCGTRKSCLPVPAHLTLDFWTILCGAFLSYRSMQSLTTKSRACSRR